jgi:predicted ATPase/DNA-binding SARP family transcriptional activator
VPDALVGPQLAVHILGGVDASWRGQTLIWFSGAGASRLLVYLLLQEDLPLRRDQVAFALWPDLDEAAARQALSRSLHRLVGYLGLDDWSPRVLERDAGALRWSRDARVWLDALALEDAARRAALSEPDAAVEAWRRVVDLWRGEVCPGWEGSWLEPVRQRLRGRYLAALGRLADAYAARGDLGGEAATCARLLAADPLRERVVQRLMACHWRLDDRPAALGVYEAFVASAADRLGLEPAPETVALAEGIRLGAMRQPSAETGLDLSAGAMAGEAHHVPSALSRFIGREAELAQVGELVGRDRLVTIVGPGGAGKTRLAAELARRLAPEWPGGVWWVELAELERQQDPGPTFAAALGVPTGPGRPPAEALAQALGERRSLLVLDNCEHLIEPLRDLVTRLVGGCAAVHLVATSREALGLSGEAVWHLPPMAMPAGAQEADEGALRRSEAVSLFVDRVMASWPELTFTPQRLAAAARICRRLDGIPLAIELVAARVGVLSVEELAARLETSLDMLRGGRAPGGRHATMEAATAWSYDSLNPAEQSVFRQLGVFVGGFSLEAAQAVCVLPGDGPRSADQVLQHVARLADTSLVDLPSPGAGGRRLRLLEVIREHALRQLAAQGDLAAVSDRHAAWFAGLAASAAAAWTGPDRPGWMATLDVEEANLWAGLAWLRGGDETAAALRMAVDLGPYWFARDRCGRERELLVALLTQVPGLPADRLVGEAEATVARLAYRNGDVAQSRAWFERARATFGQLGDGAGRARVTDQLAVVCLVSDEVHTARQLAEEALATWSSLGRQDDVMRMSIVLVDILFRCGEFERARPILARCEAWQRTAGDDLARDNIIDGLIHVHWQQARYAEALRLIELRRSSAKASGDREGLRAMAVRAGLVAMDQGHYDRAEASFKRSLALARELRNDLYVARALNNLGELALRLGDFPLAAEYLRRSLAMKRDVDSAWSRLHTRFSLVELALATGEDPEPVWPIVAEARALGARDLQSTALLLAGHGPGERARRALLASLALEAQMGRRRHLAIAAEAIAAAAIAAGAPGPATGCLMGFAEALRREIGAPPTAREAVVTAGTSGRLREVLAAESLGAALAAGADLSRDEALEVARTALTRPRAPGRGPGQRRLNELAVQR